MEVAGPVATSSTPSNGAGFGVLLGSHYPPDRIVGLARHAESSGFDEIWIAEDRFSGSALVGSAAALGATDAVAVGSAVLPIAGLHPAVVALEWSCLARQHPSRLRLGLGVGAYDRLRPPGGTRLPVLGRVRQFVDLVRRLFAGERVAATTPGMACDGVQLEYPPDVVPPILLGAIGRRMLALSGEIADGTVFGVMASRAFLDEAIPLVMSERHRGGARVGRHLMPVTAFYSQRSDRDEAHEAVWPVLQEYLRRVATGAGVPYTDALGVTRQIASGEEVSRRSAASLINQLAVAGTGDDCASTVSTLFDAGASSVVLCPWPPEEAEQLITLAGEELLPHARSSARHGRAAELSHEGL